MSVVKLTSLSPEEALAYFRSKGMALADDRFDYRDVWRETHASTFVVAKAMQDDVLALIRDEFEKNLAEGGGLQAFQADLPDKLARAGWWGKGMETDPRTGEAHEVQKGSMHRLKVIFDTNMRTSQAAGRWARIQRTKSAFPYLCYNQVDRPTKRPAHARFHGLVRPVDDPIWERIYPPNGWFCACSVTQITQGQIDRGQYTVSPPFDLEEDWVENLRSGQDELVPRGLTPGFDVNPGMVWWDMKARMEPLAGPKNHAVKIGVAEKLRDHATFEKMERGVFITPEGEIRHPRFGSQARGGAVPLPDPAVIPGGWDFVHSHPFEGSISPTDVFALFRMRLASLTAVTPGGSVFSIAPGLAAFDERRERQRFQLVFLAVRGALPREKDLASLVLNEVFLRHLERGGVIEYHRGACAAYADKLRATEHLVTAILERDEWQAGHF